MAIGHVNCIHGLAPLSYKCPQTRDGSFSTEIFKRYQRSEQAFVLALMEMVVNGVSTRKVTNITEELCGVSFSKSTVSQLCAGLAPKVRVFNERRLDEAKFPFIMVDATFIKSREGDRVVSKDIAEKAKLVLQAPDTAEAKRRLTEFIERFERLAPKAVTCLEEAFEEARSGRKF